MNSKKNEIFNNIYPEHNNCLDTLPQKKPNRIQLSSNQIKFHFSFLSNHVDFLNKKKKGRKNEYKSFSEL